MNVPGSAYRCEGTLKLAGSHTSQGYDDAIWGGGTRSWSCAVGFDRLLDRLQILTLGSYWEDWEWMRLERRCV